MQLSGVPGKKYGLQIPEVEEEEVESFEQALAKDAERKRNNKKITDIYENALQQDPTAFDYDGVYDQIHDQRKSDQDRKKEEAQKRQPRYIQAILDKTKERKREQDIIYDRKLQREKEQEGNLFGDKEKFVTAAYKKKLIEQKKWLEEEAKREEEERAQDVTKRADLSDFYTNLLNNNIGTSNTKQSIKTTSAPKPTQSQAPSKFPSAVERPQESKPRPEQYKPTPPQSQAELPKLQQEKILPVENQKNESGPTQREDESKRKADDKPDEKEEQPKISRRNDDKAISEARMRYLMRKAAKETESNPSS